MKRTAAFILNHNLPDHTNKLYELLKPYERTDYYLFIIENGSKESGMSKYATHMVEKNGYYGGGYNAAMSIVLENNEFDSLMLVNNDISLHPHQFVKTLRSEMFSGENNINYDIVSPCIFNIFSPTPWPAMFNWGSPFIRSVPFVDFQCALVSRRLLEKVKSIDYDLMYGWGIDVWFSMMASKNGWKVGVLDRLFAVHYDALTTRTGAVDGLTLEQYVENAKSGAQRFFKKNNLEQEYNSLLEMSRRYVYNSNNNTKNTLHRLIGELN